VLRGIIARGLGLRQQFRIGAAFAAGGRIIGASPDTAIIRGRTLKVMLQQGFPGRIYPISRSHAEVQGLKAYPSIAALPDRADLAVLTIPAANVLEELERCGEAGVRAALVVASGFAEDKADGGAAMQKRIGELARRYDMAVCGPNSEGFLSARRLCPTFSPAVETLDVPLLPERGGGRVAVVSQSGGIGFSFFDRGRPREIPFSHVVTTGNEAALECFDVVDYLLDEGSADVFVLFLETIRNADTFRRAAAKALRMGKPIIVAKIGRSEAGGGVRRRRRRRAGLPRDVSRCGIIEGADISRWSTSRPRSRSTGAFPLKARQHRHPSAARRDGSRSCVAAGLEVPGSMPGPEPHRGHIPSYGTSQNPVDCTAQAVPQHSKLATSSDLRARRLGDRRRLGSAESTRARPGLGGTRDAKADRRIMPLRGCAITFSAGGLSLIASMHNCARAPRWRYRAVRERRRQDEKHRRVCRRGRSPSGSLRVQAARSWAMRSDAGGACTKCGRSSHGGKRLGGRCVKSSHPTSPKIMRVRSHACRRRGCSCPRVRVGPCARKHGRARTYAGCWCENSATWNRDDRRAKRDRCSARC
jgi:succinyl-CoA synthetase alpha subunit